MLTLEQRVYLVQCYGTGEASYNFAIQKFQQKFPNVHVCVNALRNLVQKFERTGSVHDIKKRKRIHDEEDAATILALDSAENYPKLSLRKRSIQLRQFISKSHLHRIFKENKIKPYKPIFVHELRNGDDALRLDFCLWVGENQSENRNFYKNIIFSDESTFTTNGKVATQNCRFWARENPNFKIATRSQYYKKVNVWCGVMYGKIIGPYFFNANVNQHTYLDMLQNFLMPAVTDEPNFQSVYFQQDGCPAHSTLLVRNYLQEYFGNRWIGRYGPVNWPARSPDLSPLDFFLWGYVKQRVYNSNLDNNIEILKQKITEAVNSVTEDMIHNVYKEFVCRTERCVEVGGNHIE